MARTGRPPTPLFERFMAQHRFDLATGCWPWTSTLDRDGYGYIKDERRVKHRAHRIAYRLFVGAIPVGLTIDHLCRNRACVNPAHLEPVTARENTLRGESSAARYARRTHCERGHLLDGWKGEGYRYCKTCHRERVAAWRRRLGRAA